MKGGEYRLETTALTSLIAVSQPTPLLQVASPEEALIFQELLGGLTTDEGLQDEPQVSETANQVETSEESKEETTEMADALAQAMQYFIRLPMQQPPVTELKTADFASIEQDALIPTVVAPLTEQPEDNSKMIEPTSTEITKDTPAPPIIHEQQPMDTTEEVSEIEDGKVTFELPSKPESDMLKQEETKVEFLENISVDGAKDMKQILPIKALEKKTSVENDQPESQSVGGIQTPTRTITQQAASTTVEVTKTTLTWQEPAQVIRELGETIKVTLEQSPTPATKVVQISLTPETFGKMEIELTWQDDKVAARIVVQKDAVKQQLTDQLDLIREFLPKNPIIQTIAIDVRPPNMLFQPHQGFQSRKQSQHAPKQHLADDKEQEEIEGASVLEGRGLSLYI